MLKRLIFVGIIVLPFVSCHNKLDILASYKESVAVYGLLNQDDTAQYIRIQRVFLGEGNALIMAQNQDSVYFKPNELKVTLQRFKNGAQVSVDVPASSAMEIVLTETTNQLQPGVFNINQLLYKTNHKLFDDSQYKLVVHSNKSGKEFTSTTAIGLIGDFKSQLTFGGTQQSILVPNPTGSILQKNIVPSGVNGNVFCKFGSPVNSGVCGLTLRFYYTEYYFSGPSVAKYEDFPLGIQYTTQTQGAEEIDLSYLGDGMMQNIANAIHIDANIDHRIADSVHFILNAAGFDVSLYNQVNNTTTLSQDKPSYGNIKDAVGVFSSRREFALVKKINGTGLDRLSKDKLTCLLRFYGFGGTLLPCN